MNSTNQGASNPTQEQLYSQYQTIINQLQTYTNQEASINAVIDELRRNLQTVKGLQKHDLKSEIIIPLGGLVRIKAKLIGVEEILVNIGSDVIVPTGFENAIKTLDEKIIEMTDLVSRLSKDKQQLESMADQIRTKLNN